MPGQIGQDIVRLGWISVEVAADLCSVPAQWLLDELLSGGLHGIQAKATYEEERLGLSIWAPSLHRWIREHQHIESVTQ